MYVQLFQHFFQDFLDIFQIFGLIFKLQAIQDELLNISKYIISKK